MARRSTDPVREQFWRRIIAQWQASGLSVRDFCRSRQLREPSFYAWRRTLALRDRQRPAAPTPNMTSAARPQSAAAGFVPVRVVPADALEVVVRSGQTVRVGVGFDAAHLRAVVAALEAKSC
jgi:transposase-like protein